MPRWLQSARPAWRSGGSLGYHGEGLITKNNYCILLISSPASKCLTYSLKPNCRLSITISGEIQVVQGNSISRGWFTTESPVWTIPQVCDTILRHAKERFSFTKHLISATLLKGDLLPQHSVKFPDSAQETSVEAYLTLDKAKLKTELALALMQVFMENNLQDTFSENLRLLKILIATPMATAESESCFSPLKRIKTFLVNAMAQDLLNAVAMLSMEKNLIQNIPGLYTKVIATVPGVYHHVGSFFLVCRSAGASPCSWLVPLFPVWSSSPYPSACLGRPALLHCDCVALFRLTCPKPIPAHHQTHLLKISSRASLEGTVIWCEQVAPLSPCLFVPWACVL